MLWSFMPHGYCKFPCAQGQIGQNGAIKMNQKLQNVYESHLAVSEVPFFGDQETAWGKKKLSVLACFYAFLWMSEHGCFSDMAYWCVWICDLSCLSPSNIIALKFLDLPWDFSFRKDKLFQLMFATLSIWKKKAVQMRKSKTLHSANRLSIGL